MRRIGGVRGGEGERGVRRESEGRGRGCERRRGVERRGGGEARGCRCVGRSNRRGRRLALRWIRGRTDNRVCD